MRSAANAGMAAGEVIVSADGEPTPTTGALSAALAELRPGQKIRVVVKLQDGATRALQVTLGMYPGG